MNCLSQIVAIASLVVLVVPIRAAQPVEESTASLGVERTDPASKAAHERLVKRAKQGGIDVYFLGDSITRRWAAEEDIYAPLLRNWQSNFGKLRVANFGWGGDTTSNILWRIEHGELAGVHPKAIVILAGTNDVGTRLDAETPGIDEQLVADAARGIEAIVASCRRQAPDAVIIVTAIFPRNDKPTAGPIIDSINRRLTRLSDEKKEVLVLNINEKLADGPGKLRPGVSADGLHLEPPGYQIWADGLKAHLDFALQRR